MLPSGVVEIEAEEVAVLVVLQVGLPSTLVFLIKKTVKLLIIVFFIPLLQVVAEAAESITSLVGSSSGESTEGSTTSALM